MIQVREPYKPIYTNKDKFIILLTGGRGGGKSFEASTFIERLSFEEGHKILYSRYTMTSANISVIPEFEEKIEKDNTAKYFKINAKDIENTRSGSVIMFRGIKTSSGNQTANLKSIQGLTTFVGDEMEEWVSEDDYDKLRLSIRTKGIQNRIILIMNPTDVNHFVYQKYIKDTHKIIDVDGVPVQISTHPSVLHIHTTYLDNLDNLSEQFIEDVKRIKETDTKKYENVVIGRWADIAEGVIFKSISIVPHVPKWVKKSYIGLDFGFTNDPTAIVKVSFLDNEVYIEELCYKTHMLTSDIIAELKKHHGIEVISESADPRLVKEIHNAGINITAVTKGQGSIMEGINKMLEYDIKVTKTSYEVLNEFRNYTWAKDVNSNYINKPIDKYNHAIDGIRYVFLEKILGNRRRKKQSKQGIFY